MNESYTIKLGDNLTKIANNNQTSVQQLVELNHIQDPSKIYVGQKLLIPKQNYSKILNTDQIKQHENQINTKKNEEIINYYHQIKNTNTPYIIDDKINNTLNVYINGKLIRSFKAIHGKNSTKSGNYYNKKTKTSVGYGYVRTEIDPDEMTVTYVDDKGKIINLGGNLTTPAGIFFTTKSGNYHGAPSFMRRTKEQVKSNSKDGIPNSIHARTITENANTNGCTGLSVQDLKELDKLLQGYDNIPTYILPANNKNKFFIRNGELQFFSHNTQKTPSYNTIVSNPIEKISLNLKNLDNHQRKIIQEFSRGLIKNKKSLQKELQINDDTYNELCNYAIGILGVESNYGIQNSWIGNVTRGAKKLVSRGGSSPDVYAKYNGINLFGIKIGGAQKDNNSIGLTQIRYSYLSNEEKKLYNKYNITKDSLVNDPEKAAIATMIKLATEFKNQGRNMDKTIKSWNNRSNYLDRVKNAAKRATIFQKYTLINKKGGILNQFKNYQNFLKLLNNY